MSLSSSTMQTSLQNVFSSKADNWFKQILLILGGVFILACASQLSIPLKPVPLTFQSATVVLIGMAYGSRRGASTIFAYLALGALGLPVFADFSFGVSKFFGPTGGYLVGFLPAAFLSGYLAEKGWAKYSISSFFAAVLGVGIIFGLGLAQLSQFVGWQNALALGLTPFMLSECIKLVAVSLLIPRLWTKQS